MGARRGSAMGAGATLACALGAGLAIGACAIVGGAGGGGDEWDRAAAARPAVPGGMLVVAGGRVVAHPGVAMRGSAMERLVRLPRIGTLAWRCDPLGAAGVRPSVTLTGQSGTVTGRVDAPGVPATRFRADPGQQVVSAVGSAARQAWRLRYDHPPRPLTALLTIRFARDPRSGECAPADARLRTTAGVERVAGDERAGGRRCATGAWAEVPPLRALVLACGRTAGGERVELRALPDGSGASPCLTVVGLAGGPRGCARAPGERVPATRAALGAVALVRRAGPDRVDLHAETAPGVHARRPPTGRAELYAETAPAVRRVDVVDRVRGGPPVSRRALLLRVADPALLAAVGIDEPFGVAVALARPGAIGAALVARDRRGRRLDRRGRGLDRRGRRLGRAAAGRRLRWREPAATRFLLAPGS